MRSALAVIVAIWGSAYSSAVLAHSCDTDLVYGLVISEHQIRYVTNSHTQVQINNDEQLFIRGEWVHLDTDRTAILREFSLGIRNEVPTLVNLAMDGVDIGLDAIEQVVAGLSGEARRGELSQQLQEVQLKLHQRFTRGDGFYYIAPQSLGKLDDFLNDDLHERMHSAVHGSLGAILTALGSAVQSGDGGLEERISDVGSKMDVLSEYIDMSLQNQATQLKQKAELFCARMQELDKIENRLQQAVPRLADFNLVVNHG